LQDHVWSSYPAYCGLARKVPVWLEREKVLGTYGFTEGEAWSLRGYRERMERFMRFEEDPAAGMRGEFDKQIKRGWYIGSEEFKERLDGLLMGRTRNDNHRGSQRRDHGPKEAERLWREGLRVLGVAEDDLLAAKGTRMEKQALAWLMKKHSAVNGRWIAERTEMGHPSTASLAINRFSRDQSTEAKRLKSLLVQELIVK